MNHVEYGDCRDTMLRWAEEGVRVQTCVTSPPYWGLRDYGVDGQLGQENTPEEFVANMVQVFRYVRELLADDGTCWLNIGDCYSTGSGGENLENDLVVARAGSVNKPGEGNRKDNPSRKRKPYRSVPAKNLMFMPFRLALALQEDGWIMRMDIIWHKKNCMPESAKDRPTKAHEYLFLMTKNPQYYYDAEAIKEPASPDTHARYSRARSEDHKRVNGAPGQEKSHTLHKPQANIRKAGVHPKAAEAGSGIRANESFSHAVKDPVSMVNKRSVWQVATQGYAGAHFATFPPELIKPCILAGSRPGDVVLDPFFGSGTTGEVALSLGRQFLGCELNENYRDLIEERTSKQLGMGL